MKKPVETFKSFVLHRARWPGDKQNVPRSQLWLIGKHGPVISGVMHGSMTEETADQVVALFAKIGIAVEQDQVA